MVSAKAHVPIVKKHTKRFNRHQSDRFKCVDPSWRKPKGIDNRVRRRFKGQAAMPKVRSIPSRQEGYIRTLPMERRGLGAEAAEEPDDEMDVHGMDWTSADDMVLRLDRLRQQQEDPPHDAFRPQGFPRQQHPRPRPSSHAQQDLRRGVRLRLSPTTTNSV